MRLRILNNSISCNNSRDGKVIKIIIGNEVYCGMVLGGGWGRGLMADIVGRGLMGDIVGRVLRVNWLGLVCR